MIYEHLKMSAKNILSNCRKKFILYVHASLEFIYKKDNVC